ncbi:hypothetical protein ALC53_12412, partial [Atta colombica]
KEMKDLIEREIARIRRDIQENVDREIRKLREKRAGGEEEKREIMRNKNKLKGDRIFIENDLS